MTDRTKLDPSQVGCRMDGGRNTVSKEYLVLDCAGSSSWPSGRLASGLTGLFVYFEGKVVASTEMSVPLYRNI